MSVSCDTYSGATQKERCIQAYSSFSRWRATSCRAKGANPSNQRQIVAPRPTAPRIMSAVANREPGTGLRPWAQTRLTANSLPSAALRQESPAMSPGRSENEPRPAISRHPAPCNLHLELPRNAPLKSPLKARQKARFGVRWKVP